MSSDPLTAEKATGFADPRWVKRVSLGLRPTEGDEKPLAL